MRSLIAFIKKEMMEQVRSGKAVILGIVFILFGIMNPAVAKLTPWLLDVMADSLAESGMMVTDVTVSAMDSWVQFFKNIPLALTAFVLVESNIFTQEYGTGTLVLSLTKGLERYKVVISKTLVLTVFWTLGFWMCFGITYGYNAYFWDNAAAQNLIFAVACWWLFGMLTIALMVLFSAVADANTGVLLGTGGVLFASYMVGLLPKCGKYLPAFLMDGNSLIYGMEEATAYMPSILITAAAAVICFVISIPIFNKKHL